MKYFLLQLGCAMNHADGERISTVLGSMGFEKTDDEGEASLLGIVACSVRQKAIDRVYARIARWNQWKSEKALLTFVSGCILPADREKFLDRFDLVFSINDLTELPSLMAQYGVSSPLSQRFLHQRPEIGSLEVPSPTAGSARPAGPLWLKDQEGAVLKPGGHAPRPQGTERIKAWEQRVEGSTRLVMGIQEELAARGGASGVMKSIPLASDPAEDPMGGFWAIKPDYQSFFEAHIPIQNGCDKFCTFCAVPYTRGRETSRPARSILEEVAKLLDQGYRSITLLGQNVNSYGRDKPDTEPSFAELLEEIARLGEEKKARFWLYFTSPHPRDMTRDVLETMARHRCIAKQVHLPLQSGDDKVLIRMNRAHSLGRYREIVRDIRDHMPEATIFTDIIVGFSGETEEQFEHTRAAMEEFKYAMAFIAQYSPRPGAASARWDDDVAPEVKKERLVRLNEVLHRTAREYNQSQVGKVLTVLVTGADQKKGYLTGYTEGRINARFPLPGNEDPAHWLGAWVDLDITGGRDMSLEGRLVGEPVFARSL